MSQEWFYIMHCISKQEAHLLFIARSKSTGVQINFKNSLIIQEQNTKKNHKRVVVLYVIKNHVNLHKL